MPYSGVTHVIRRWMRRRAPPRAARPGRRSSWRPRARTSAARPHPAAERGRWRREGGGGARAVEAFGRGRRLGGCDAARFGRRGGRLGGAVGAVRRLITPAA
eukprot:2466106-Prymnesium_polylepis.1